MRSSYMPKIVWFLPASQKKTCETFNDTFDNRLLVGNISDGQSIKLKNEIIFSASLIDSQSFYLFKDITWANSLMVLKLRGKCNKFFY